MGQPGTPQGQFKDGVVSPEVQEEPLPSQVMNEEGVGVVMLSELRTREKEMGSAL